MILFSPIWPASQFSQFKLPRPLIDVHVCRKITGGKFNKKLKIRSRPPFMNLGFGTISIVFMWDEISSGYCCRHHRDHSTRLWMADLSAVLGAGEDLTWQEPIQLTIQGKSRCTRRLRRLRRQDFGVYP